MMQIAAFAFVLTLAVIGSSPALAHRPYFTQVEMIQLPNGEMGQARLLNGDGILGPDPVRVIILDAQGRLLARSDQSLSMRISCRDGGNCLIFDFSIGRVLKLDSSRFRQGAQVPGLADEHRNELWDLESGEEAWGFTTHRPGLVEWIVGFGGFILQYMPMVGFNGLIGGLCVLLGKATWLIARRGRNHLLQVLIRIISALVIIGTGLVLVLASGLFSLLAGMPFMGWLGFLGIGAGAAFVGSHLFHKFRSA